MKSPTTLILVCELAGLAWAAVLVPLAVLVLLTAVTTEGRIAGLGTLALGLAPVLGAVAWDRESQLTRRVASILAAGFVAAVAALAALRPVRLPPAGAAVQVLGGEAGNRGFLATACGLLPEVDQLRFGFTVMPAFDPVFTFGQAARLRDWTTVIYSEMGLDPRFVGLPSALPDAYSDILAGGPVGEHAFLYVPSGLDRTTPVPALVFLHGSGGNFQAYLWLLSRLADRLQVVVIAPTGGAGNWRPAESHRVVAAAFAAACRSVSIDAANIHVLGLSNGGRGVTRLAAVHGSRYRSLVYLSPVFGDISDHPTAATAWHGRAVLVLSGRQDDRVPAAHVEERAAKLAAIGAMVTVEWVDGADHFLFFSHRARVAEGLERWLREHGVPAPKRISASQEAP